MGNLVVGQGERLGSSAVQVFQPQFFLDVQPAVAAKDAIGENDLVCLGDSVFGQDCDPEPFFRRSRSGRRRLDRLPEGLGIRGSSGPNFCKS